VNGYLYANKQRTPLGLVKTTLKPGIDGKAKLAVNGKGDRLLVPPAQAQPLSVPLRVQLQRRDGGCWESTFSTTGIKKNEIGLFKGISD